MKIKQIVEWADATLDMIWTLWVESFEFSRPPSELDFGRYKLVKKC